MSTLRVAVAQFELRAERTFDDFATHVADVAAQAAEQGAQALLLPELVTTGLLATSSTGALAIADLTPAYREIFPSLTDEYRTLMSDLATSHEMAIVGGSHYRRSGDEYRNTAYLFQPDGTVEQQDKLHLTPAEFAMGTSPGDDLLVADIAGFTAGILICADIEFPELTRELARRGVSLVLVPSLTWNRRGAWRVRYGAHARAMENQLYVAVSPLVGSSGLPHDGPVHGTGHALVTTPIDRTFGHHDGVLAAHPDDRTEGLLVVDLDSDLIRTSRTHPEPPGLKYVRNDLYDRLRRAGQRHS